MLSLIICLSRIALFPQLGGSDLWEVSLQIDLGARVVYLVEKNQGVPQQAGALST